MNITHKFISKTSNIQSQYFPLTQDWCKYGLKEPSYPSYIDIKSRATVLTPAFKTKKIGSIPTSVVRKLRNFIKKYYLNHVHK